MRKSLLILPLFLLFACVEADEIFVPTEDPSAEEEALLFRPGLMVVKVTPALSSSLERQTVDGKIAPLEVSELQDVAKIIGMESLERLFRPAGIFEARSREEGMHLWYQLSFDPSFPVSKARDLMKAHPGISTVECDPMKRLYPEDTVVEYAAPSGVILADAPFNDPLLYRQWHYCNDGSREGTEPE